jgi:hypothetical protein
MIILLARIPGGEKNLSQDEIAKLSEISLKSYGKKIKI